MASPQMARYCPCCNYLTLPDLPPGTFAICTQV